MSHPMYPRLKDFVENVSNGSIAINRLIPVQSSMGDQIFQVPFPQYCDKMAEMERVPKLTIYRLVQDAINKGFLQRMNRSDVFQKGVEGACNRVESGVSAPSLFEDTVQRPFLTSYYDTERDKMNELLSMISEIEREVESGKGDRGEIEGFMENCSVCNRHLDKQEEILEENASQYIPNHPKVWRELALTPRSHYRTEAPSSDYPRYAQKHMEKYLPQGLQTIFDNGLYISHFLEIENHRLREEIRKCREQVEALQQKGEYLHSNVQKPSRNFLMRMLAPSSSDEEEEEEEEEEDGEIDKLAGHLQKISKKGPPPHEPPREEEESPHEPPREEEEPPPHEPPREEEEDEEDEDEEDEDEEDEEGQLGGMFYLDMKNGKKDNKKGKKEGGQVSFF